MSLTGWMLRRAFTDGALEVGLYLKDKEVSAPGYRRMPLDGWRITDKSAVARTVTFGPYDGAAVYDRYVLFSDGEQVHSVPETGVAQMPPRFSWGWTAELVLG